MAKCKGCGAEIMWIRTKGAQKAMPVDCPGRYYYRSGAGSQTFVTADGEVMRGNLTGNEDGIMGYRSHFATCPQAGKWRRH